MKFKTLCVTSSLFPSVEATETMRAYVAHNMNGNEDLITSLKMVKSEVVAARKLDEEGVCLLRKAKENKEASQTKTHRLAKEKQVMATEKKKAEEEVARLR